MSQQKNHKYFRSSALPLQIHAGTANLNEVPLTVWTVLIAVCMKQTLVSGD